MNGRQLTNVYFATLNHKPSHDNCFVTAFVLPGVCRTGVLSFLRVLPPLLFSMAGEEATFSGAGVVEVDTEL